MKGNTLEQRVMAKLGDDVRLPSAIETELKFCSKKLARTTTIEEFEEIMSQYSLLDDHLKKVGLSTNDFKRIIEDMKKEQA